MSRARRPDAVVIGAGLSGLTAALRLEEAGLDVQLVEARRRIGGRIRSVPTAAGTLESGGATIGGGYRRVLAAAERHGVGLVDATPLLRFFREQELVLDGGLVGRTEWPDHPANPFPERDRDLMPWNFARVLTERENPLDTPEDWLDPSYARRDVPLRDWMKTLGLSEAAIRVGYDLNPAFGRDAADVSALLVFFRAAFSASQRRAAPEGVVGFNLEGGAARLPERMAAASRPRGAFRPGGPAHRGRRDEESPSAAPAGASIGRGGWSARSHFRSCGRSRWTRRSAGSRAKPCANCRHSR